MGGFNGPGFVELHGYVPEKLVVPFDVSAGEAMPRPPMQCSLNQRARHGFYSVPRMPTLTVEEQLGSSPCKGPARSSTRRQDRLLAPARYSFLLGLIPAEIHLSRRKPCRTAASETIMRVCSHGRATHATVPFTSLAHAGWAGARKPSSFPHAPRVATAEKTSDHSKKKASGNSAIRRLANREKEERK
jgi:hypothetical protein